MFDELYQQLLLEHAKSPHNRGKLEGDVFHIELLNPLCGDEVSMWVRMNGRKVEDVKFEGKGCFISQAAASLVTDRAKGIDIEELRGRIADFRALMYGKDVPQASEKLGDIMALEGVKRFPMRVKCALLAFEALEKATKDVK